MKKMTPRDLARAFQDIHIQDDLTKALERQALRLQATVQASLGGGRGEAHNEPWRQTGALQDSISCNVEGLVANVGTNDPAAAPQEFGTAHVPPRPFLMPATVGLGESVGSEIARVLVKSITGTRT